MTDNKPLPKYILINREIKLVPTKSTNFNTSTHLQLTHPPNISTFSIKPHLLNPSPRPHSPFPATLLQSSNGLLLFALETNRDPHTQEEKHKPKTPYSHYFCVPYTHHDRLFLTNPITNELIKIPLAPHPHDMRFGHGLISRVNPDDNMVEKFVVVEYYHIPSVDKAFLQCFSSESAKWVVKPTDYMLGARPFRPVYGFEFKERFFWVFLNVGLIMWDEDPFIACETTKKAPCRLIPIPPRCVRPVMAMEMPGERHIGVSGGFIQFLELDTQQGWGRLNLWRLKDVKRKVGEWELMHTVDGLDLANDLSRELKQARPSYFFVHPVDVDAGYFVTGALVFSYNLRTRKVGSVAEWSDSQMVITHMIPDHPTSLPPRFGAEYAKEQGNEYFKSQDFVNAIECYCKSIALSPTAATYANRAMAYLKVCKFHEAEDDCTKALDLDGGYSKVYVRRALARKELNNLDGALEDVKRALSLDPDCEEFKNVHAEIKSLHEKASAAEGGGHGQKGASSNVKMKKGKQSARRFL